MRFGAALGRLWEPRQEARQATFESLVSDCWDELWRYAYRLTGNRDEAEDLLSESLLDGFRSFHNFRGDAPFCRWMYRVVSTTHLDMRRRAKRHQAESLDAPPTEEGEEGAAWELPDESTSPESLVVDPVVSEEVQRALDALPDDFRTVVALVDMQGVDYEEASQTLGIPIGTVRSRLHRARSQLRRALAAYVGSK